MAILEYRYHHIRQILGRFRLYFCLHVQVSPDNDQIETLLQSPITVIDLSLQYSALGIYLVDGMGEKHAWLYGCKFPFEFAVDCLFKACLYFEERRSVPRDLVRVRERVLRERSSYLPMSPHAILWLEGGLNRVS